MDVPPALNPQPETLGSWIPPQGESALMEALRRAAALKSQGSQQPPLNALIALLTGRQ